ncbi:MAG: S49 family peptidase [Pseudomonadota bacterium]
MSRISRYISNKPHVAVIRLEGVISSGTRPGGSAMSDASMAPMIERAFRSKPVAVALQVNSPGGSPVQSSLIAARIRRLAEEHKLRVYAFCEDVAASGGYWLATAADEIYIDESSILGSIGVISASFGLHEFINRYGIERRVHTAGEDKSMLDPFRPEREKDIERLKELQQVIHTSFINQVKRRRAGHLAEADLFSGEIFVGQNAVDMGLADGLGHLVPMMKHKYGEKTNFTVQRPRRSLFSRFGIPGAEALIGAAEDRAVWARYGL